MKQNKLKIGLLGGSFDPVHNGHLHFAREMMKALELKEVWFVPAGVNPHKTKEPPVNVQHRLNMILKAIKGYPYFRLMDIESSRCGPSFTVDTLKFLKGSYPETEFYLLIGDDVAKKFETWKDAGDIINLCKVAVGTRFFADQSLELDDNPISRALLAGRVKMPVLKVSSTDVRNQILANENCENGVPAGVLQYIKEHGLYTECD